MEPPIGYTTDEASGAMKNGTRVEKVYKEKNDYHPLGARATVLGSLSHPTVGTGYFVEWDDMPGVPVFVVARKIGAIGGVA